jgi:hypothetical protein
VTDQEFQIACLYLQDCQRLIAAGKLQRWDVVKWTLTVNFALATASGIAHKAQGYFFFLSVLVAALGFILIVHYNQRITRAREDSNKPVTYLMNNQIDIEAIGCSPATYSKDDWLWLYDFPERAAFAYAVFLISIMPALVAWLFVM